jgi:hypothetical protein
MNENNINITGDEARLLLQTMASHPIVQLFLKLQQLSLVQPANPVTPQQTTEATQNDPTRQG